MVQKDTRWPVFSPSGFSCVVAQNSSLQKSWNSACMPDTPWKKWCLEEKNWWNWNELHLTSQPADPPAGFFDNASSSSLELSTHEFRSHSHLKPGSNNTASKAAVATSLRLLHITSPSTPNTCSTFDPEDQMRNKSHWQAQHNGHPHLIWFTPTVRTVCHLESMRLLSWAIWRFL